MYHHIGVFNSKHMKEKHFYFGVLIIVIAITVGVFVIASSDSPAGEVAGSKYSSSELSAESTFHDFGDISMAHGDVRHEFEVTNNGDEPLSIEKVYTSCMCTEAEITNSEGKRKGIFGMPGHGKSSTAYITLEPYETIKVAAVFDPAAHGPMGVGRAKRSIYIETNSTINPKLELSFQAMVAR